MPRPDMSTTKAARRSHRTVNYVTAKGQVVLAKVTGGSAGTLNLRLPSYPAASRELTGILKRTTVTQTNRWF
jgi:hypothetical protein